MKSYEQTADALIQTIAAIENVRWDLKRTPSGITSDRREALLQAMTELRSNVHAIVDSLIHEGVADDLFTDSIQLATAVDSAWWDLRRRHLALTREEAARAVEVLADVRAQMMRILDRLLQIEAEEAIAEVISLCAARARRAPAIPPAPVDESIAQEVSPAELPTPGA